MALRLPFVQEYITGHALRYYADRVSTPARIGAIYLDFPTNLVIREIYVEDQRGDTLVYADKISAATNLLPLIRSQLTIADLEIQGLRGSLYSDDANEFNYQYIVDAFASADTGPTDNTGGFDLSIEGVTLYDSEFSYSDKGSGVDFATKVDELRITTNAFDLDSSYISVDYLFIDGSNTSLKLYNGNAAPSSDTMVTNEGNFFYLNGEFAEISDARFHLEQAGELAMDVTVGTLQITIDTLDINNQIYLAKNIEVVNPSVMIESYHRDSSTVEESDTVSGREIILSAGAQNFRMSGGQFRYWDHATTKNEGFDPSHLWLDALMFEANDTRFTNGHIQTNISNARYNDPTHNRHLDQLSGNFIYSDSLLSVEDLRLKYGQSTLQASVALSYPGLESLVELSEQVGVRLDVDESSINPSDITYFVPDLSQYVPTELQTMPIAFTTHLRGTVGDISGEGLDVTWGESRLTIPTARVKNGLDFPEAVIMVQGSSIRLRQRAGRQWLDSIMPTRLPEDLNLDFDVFYTPDTVQVSSILTSSAGGLQLEGSGNMGSDSLMAYKVHLMTTELNLGWWLNDPEMGVLVMETNINGKGLAPETLLADIDLVIEKFEFHGYTYTNFDLHGIAATGKFDGQASYNDEYLSFSFEGVAGLPEYLENQKFSLEIERADLQGLQLVDSEFKVVGNIDLNMAITPENDFNGIAEITGLGINRLGKRFSLDKITLNAEQVDSLRSLALESSFLNARIQTDFPIKELPAVTNRYINSFIVKDSSANRFTDESFSFSLDVLDTEFARSVLLPDLNYLAMKPIEGNFNGPAAEFHVFTRLDSVSYGNWRMDSLLLRIDSDSEDLTGNFGFTTVRNGALLLERLSINAHTVDDEIDLQVNVRDAFDSLRYGIGAVINAVGNEYTFAIHPDRLLINYDTWEVAHTNRVVLAPEYLWITDFNLSRNEQQVRLNSRIGEKGDSLLVFQSDNFQLAELARLSLAADPAVSGVVDGEIAWQTGTDRYGFDADMTISNFFIKEFEIGNIALKSVQSSRDTYRADLRINGGENEVAFSGQYSTDGTLKAELDIVRLQMDPLEILSQGSLSNVDGFVVGQFDVTGTLSEPLINGDLIFDSIAFEVVAFKSKLLIDKQKLVVDANRFTFNDFELRDPNFQTARINGNIFTNDFLEYALNLRVNTDKFTLIDSKKEDNPLLYGKVAATSQLDISGTNVLPRVKLDLTLSDSSQMTYVIPESSIAAQAQSDVVKFVDKDMDQNAFLASDEVVMKSDFLGLDLDATIKVSATNILTIVVDPITGDALTILGEALLNLKVRPTGDITLTGRYEVLDGAYNMDFYGLVKREFKIQKGSFILWTGDIYKAIMNVTAVYETRAKPVHSDNTERLDFQVELLLNGEILAPEIAFKLGVVEGTAAPISVQSWIAQTNQDVTQVNKQAFGLLIFNSFFDDSGNNWYDNLASNTARSSVSSLLSAELNKLSDKIDGVELTFDIDSYEDYNKQGDNVGRTQLELGVSKQLFNERVIVKFAGNFDIEGANANRSNVSDFSGDIRIEYLITEDGRYRLVGFRESNYDDLLQGEIIKTGGGFIFVRDYDALRELFKGKKIQ